MKTISKHIGWFTIYVCLITSYSQFASAQSKGETLVEESRCYACHDMSKALIGPSYTAIGVRHAPRKEIMIDVLARKIVNGGGGNWGVVPMVPNQWVSIEDARIMSEWILNLPD